MWLNECNTNPLYKVNCISIFESLLKGDSMDNYSSIMARWISNLHGLQVEIYDCVGVKGTNNVNAMIFVIMLFFMDWIFPLIFTEVIWSCTFSHDSLSLNFYSIVCIMLSKLQKGLTNVNSTFYYPSIISINSSIE